MNDIRILLVEDSEADRMLTIKALRKANLVNDVIEVEDGEKALRFLRKEREYANALTPDLILLDINLPRVSGLEVLEAIKNDERLKVIPVIILTTSDSDKDILQSYRNHANCYITKPVNFTQFIETIARIEQFWISIVRLPQQI